jgi:hypothetical protein
MKTIEANEKMYEIATKVLAEHGIYGAFVIQQSNINSQQLVFTNPKDDFLYKLHGGDRIIKRAIDTRWTDWMEGVLSSELAQQISDQIDKDVMATLLNGWLNSRSK